MNQEKTTQVITKEQDYMKNQKSDLAYVRATMKTIMEALSNKDTSVQEKKSMLGVFNALNNSAKIMVSACITEIAIEKITPTSLIEVNVDEDKK